MAKSIVSDSRIPTDFTNGITFFQTMRATQAQSGTGGVLNMAFEADDTYSPGSKLIGGVGMTDNSGTFTFPATGIYHLFAAVWYYAGNLDLQSMGLKIYTSTDSGTSFQEATEDHSTWGKMHGSYGYGGCHTTKIFDVVSTSTHKVRLQYGATSSITMSGSSSANKTYLTVIRLGDT